MNSDVRRRLSVLILEELSEKIKTHENLRRKLEAFTDLPVERVADAILNQFEYLLSSDLRELIVYLIQQDAGSPSDAGRSGVEPASGEVKEEQSSEAVTEAEEEPAAPVVAEEPEGEPAVIETAGEVNAEVPAGTETAEAEEKTPEPAAVDETVSGSIMEHFASREPFPTIPLDASDFQSADWFYLYAFSYAPDSSGKGIPVKKLRIRGIDAQNDLFLLDYGDVRFFLQRLNLPDTGRDRGGKPVPAPSKTTGYKFDHERILNILRSEEVIVPLPFWTIIQDREKIIRMIEDRYVELLRALIDVHDASEWDVEVFALDQHISTLSTISEASGGGRLSQREGKHVLSRGRNPKMLEKMVMREKALAQEIYSKLLLHAQKGKIDYIIRLDNSFNDDWKSILSARYVVGKDRRRVFCQAIRNCEDSYGEYRFMFTVRNPSIRITLAG
jgi:hypothetical protein